MPIVSNVANVDQASSPDIRHQLSNIQIIKKKRVTTAQWLELMLTNAACDTSKDCEWACTRIFSNRDS